MQGKDIKNAFWIFVLILSIGHYSKALKDTTGKFRLNLNAGLIMNRSYSNYPLRKTIDEQSITKYSAVPDAKFRTGFFLGADLLMLPKENFKIVLGISFSQTSAEYHSSYISEGPTSRSGFTKLTRATENDYQISFTSLNFHCGIRNKLSSHIFLTSSMILNSPLRVIRVLNGYTETVYSNSSGAEEKDVIFIRNEKSALKQKAANLSFRLNLEYEFSLGRSLARVFVFRNFGLLYALPWWGLGISYTIRS